MCFIKPILGKAFCILLVSNACSAPPNTSYAEIGQGLIAMKYLDQRLNPMVVDGSGKSREPGFGERKQRVYEEKTARIQEVFGEIGKAKPKWLENPRKVDQRRAAIGLKPLWEYRNGMCEFHFSMNKKYYSDLGVESAWRYPEGFLDWQKILVG